MDGIQRALYPVGLTRCSDSEVFSFLNLEMAGLPDRHILAHPRILRPKSLQLTGLCRRCAQQSGQLPGA